MYRISDIQPGKLPVDTDRHFVEHAWKFELHQGPLFKKTKNQGLLRVVPQLKRGEVLTNMHYDIGNKGTEATRKAIAKRYWWPHWDRD